MNLTSLSQFIKKYIWVLPFVIILIILGIIFLYKSNQGASNLALVPKIPPMYIDVITKQFDTNNLVAEEKEVKKLPIYNYEGSQNLLDRLQDYKAILKINGQEQETSHTTLGSGKRVFINGSLLQVYKNYLAISRPGTGLPIPSSFKPEADLSQAAHLFFEELSLVSPEKYTVTYNHPDGEFDFTDKSAEGANIKILNFTHKVSGYKVHSQALSVKTSFNKAGDLIGATYYALNATPGAKYPLINLKEAVQALALGTKPVRIYGEGELYLKTKQVVDKVILTNAYLAYFNPEKKMGPLTPVWIFEGEAIVSGKTLYLDYAIDAIKPEFLTNN